MRNIKKAKSRNNKVKLNKLFNNVTVEDVDIFSYYEQLTQPKCHSMLKPHLSQWY